MLKRGKSFTLLDYSLWAVSGQTCKNGSSECNLEVWLNLGGDRSFCGYDRSNLPDWVGGQSHEHPKLAGAWGHWMGDDGGDRSFRQYYWGAECDCAR